MKVTNILNIWSLSTVESYLLLKEPIIPPKNWIELFFKGSSDNLSVFKLDKHDTQIEGVELANFKLLKANSSDKVLTNFNLILEPNSHLQSDSENNEIIHMFLNGLNEYLALLPSIAITKIGIKFEYSISYNNLKETLINLNHSVKLFQGIPTEIDNFNFDLSKNYIGDDNFSIEENASISTGNTISIEINSNIGIQPKDEKIIIGSFEINAQNEKMEAIEWQNFLNIARIRQQEVLEQGFSL